MKFHLAVLVALSSLLLINVQNTSTYQTREILPSTGLWNYLPVFGIWARIVHYLAVDSEGLGNQVKDLDKYFKSRYPGKYVPLVNKVVEKLPKVIIAFRVLKIKDNLRNVRDPKTGRTLGEAIDIIHDIGNDEYAVNEIASRLNLVDPDNISMGGSTSTSDYDLRTTIKNVILENPMLIGDVLKDPQVVNFISGSVLQYLASNQVVHGIESLQQLITIGEITHPKMFQEGTNSLADLRDDKTGMSLIKTLEALVNIIENPNFPKELAKYLNAETVGYLHEKTQKVVSKVIEKKSNTPKTSPDASSSGELSDDQILEDVKNDVAKISAKDFVGTLGMLNIKLDEQTAESILQASQNNELGSKANDFLKELAAEKDLSPKIVVEFIAKKGVVLEEQSVIDAVQLISSLNSDSLLTILHEVGLNLPKEQVEQMQTIVKELNEEYNKKHPLPTKILPSFDPSAEDSRKAPPESIFNRNDEERDEE
ncbi:uncharacterized protein LOC135835582 [Planococcus citri]|uniref:uncharacterized protein LOC135835582 n=1 Tax=Planococcus citri TaxID=170843 RepID=UPI0031F9B95B